MTGRRLIAGMVLVVAIGAGWLWRALPDVVTEPRDRSIAAIATDRAGVVVLGTSLSHRAAWPDQLERELVACGLPAMPVVRVTRPGANSSWGRDNLEAVIAVKPALVLIEFAINDADIRDGLSRGDSRAAHRAIVQDLGRALPETRLAFMTTNPATGLRRFTRPFLGYYNADLIDLAQEMDLGVIDLAPRWHVFLASPDGAGAMPDGLHPTDTAFLAVGQRVLTKAVAKAWGQEHCPPE